MNPTGIGLAVFAFTFGGARLGMWLRALLPEGQLNAESKDTVRLGVGLIATMTALVLGLVTASAKSSFDAVEAGIRQYAIDLLALDRILARYGSETGEIRKGLQRAIGTRIDMIWGPGSDPVRLDPIRAEATSGAEGLADAIRGLSPRDDVQRALQSRAVELTEILSRARWLALVVTRASIPVPFLVALLFWLMFTFASFGLFAPRNALVVTVHSVCALSVASAVFLVLEMDGPFDGLLRVSAEPLRRALAQLIDRSSARAPGVQQEGRRAPWLPEELDDPAFEVVHRADDLDRA